MPLTNKELQAFLAQIRVTSEWASSLETLNMARTLENQVGGDHLAEAARKASEVIGLNQEVISWIGGLKLSDSVNVVLDAKGSMLLNSLSIALKEAELASQNLVLSRPTVEMRALLEWAQAPLSPGVFGLIARATAMPGISDRWFARDSVERRRIVDALAQQMDLVGEFSLPEESERERAADAESSPRLPQDAAERIERVDFLPTRLMEQIRRSPHDMRQFTARQFEEFTAELLRGIGFENPVLTPRSRDGGRDVVAAKTVNGIPVLFAFECKRYAEENKVGVNILRGLLGTLAHPATAANKGVLVTTSSFTRDARSFILSELRIEGRDFHGLVEWLRSYKA